MADEKDKGPKVVTVTVAEGRNVRWARKRHPAGTPLQMNERDALPLLRMGAVLDEEGLKKVRSAKAEAKEQNKRLNEEARAISERKAKESAQRREATRAEMARRREREAERAARKVEESTEEVDLTDLDPRFSTNLAEAPNKRTLVTYAKDHFGVDLSLEDTRDTLIAQIEALREDAKQKEAAKAEA